MSRVGTELARLRLLALETLPLDTRARARLIVDEDELSQVLRETARS